MNSAERNTRKKIRISIIDVLIVLTVLALIAGTVIHYKIYENKNEIVTDDTVTVSVLFGSVLPEVASAAKPGGQMYFANDSSLFGTVTGVDYEDADVYYTDDDHKIVAGKDAEKKDLTVTVEVKGELTSDRGFLQNGKLHIAAGMEIEVFTTEFSGKGLIFDVKKQSE